MKILPVLDIKGGVVVRGIGGRRDEYRPVQSPLVSSAEPLAVASAFRERFGLSELYVADLDAIAGQEPDWNAMRTLKNAGFRLWVDAGVRQLPDAQSLATAGVETIIIALETVSGANEMHTIAAALGRRLVFSLDMRAGRPIGNLTAWPDAHPWSVATHAVELGVQRFLFLDLASVGASGGNATEEAFARFTTAHPELELTTGGGVRGINDLLRLKARGVRNVLVATALHDGRLTREDVAGLEE